MKKVSKKGSTLAELCVVLGLVTIIGAMVVSFAVMMSQRTQLSAARLDVINEIEVVENITETWLGQMKLLGAELSVPQGQDSVFSEIHAETTDGENYRLFYNMEKGALTGTLPGGEEVSFQSDRVVGMEFSQVVGIMNSQKLFSYTLVCNLPNIDGGKEQYKQTFFVNPHVGDTYGSGGG